MQTSKMLGNNQNLSNIATCDRLAMLPNTTMYTVTIAENRWIIDLELYFVITCTRSIIIATEPALAIYNEWQ